MAKKPLRKCPTFQAIKEMKIKTMLRLNLTPLRMENTNNYKCW
jgi:hypothetical protein